MVLNSDLEMRDRGSNNRRIAKNTFVMYIRMIVMMLISLFTSRVILQVLGVTDYGVLNAVGGVVSMLSVLSGSLSRAISRYLTFELGRGDMEKLKKIFSTSLNVQIFISLIVVLVGITAGGWFLHYKMNIPADRMGAADWVLGCSLVSFAIGLISVPYSASIVSHERMSVFAYMSILQVVLKLLIVYALYLSPYDKLKTYMVLGVTVGIIIRFIYARYCKKHFEECTYKLVFDLSLFKELTSFAGWNFLGSAAWIFNSQGINILINIYFGVTLNAARGVANQLNGIAHHFIDNFMVALNPQITKSYAAGDLPYMHQLVCSGAKFSFFLVIFFAIPISLETEQILSLWLGKVPEYSVLFVRMTMLCTMTTVIGNTLVTAQLATGDIKKYQIVMTVCGFWVFPLTWLAFKLGGGPIWSYAVFAIVYFGLVFVRIYLVKDLIKMSWGLYLKGVLLKCVIVLLLSMILPLLVYLSMPRSILRLLLMCLVSFTASGAIIYWVGLNAKERVAMISMVKSVLKKGSKS